MMGQNVQKTGFSVTRQPRFSFQKAFETTQKPRHTASKPFQTASHRPKHSRHKDKNDGNKDRKNAPYSRNGLNMKKRDRFEAPLSHTRSKDNAIGAKHKRQLSAKHLTQNVERLELGKRRQMLTIIGIDIGQRAVALFAGETKQAHGAIVHTHEQRKTGCV